MLGASIPAAAYSSANVKGTYSVLLTSNQGSTTHVILGILTFDGTNKVTLTETSERLNGTTFAGATFSGTYFVNANGSGSMTFSTFRIVFFRFVLNSVVNGIAKDLHILTNSSDGLNGTAIHQ
jgi:hypothetical protein